MSALRLFTSESVTEGHPDKICDQISDSVLDGLLSVDRGSRVAVETLVTTGLVHVAGEIRTDGYVDIPTIVRDVVNGIGYTSSDTGFDGSSCGVTVSVGEQSMDIANGVDNAQERRDGGTLQCPASGCPAGCMRPESGSMASSPAASTSCSRMRDSRRRWREAVFLTMANSQVATDDRPSNEFDDCKTCTHASCTASSANAGEFTMVRAKLSIGR